jgi:hypothetical protein
LCSRKKTLPSLHSAPKDTQSKAHENPENEASDAENDSSFVGVNREQAALCQGALKAPGEKRVRRCFHFT